MNLNQSTLCVFDKSGLFVSLARRLGESGAKVYYQTTPDRRDQVNEAVIGDGMSKSEHGPIEVVEEFESVIDRIDTFVFPDVRFAAKQKFLRKLGYNVWGAADGMALELDRLFFLKKLAELGLDVPDYDVVTGITKLRDYLMSHKDIYIKTSKWRGSWETIHWRSADEDAHLLDLWAVRFGGLREWVTFICFPEIETELEIGADTYSIDGEWPDYMLHGIESKDSAYFSAVTARDKMPEPLLPIMEAFSPFLKECQYRQQWSMEVRVKEPYHYFIDATARAGLPSTASQILAMKNLPEVIYHGARGQMVQPEYDCLFTAEAMVRVKGHHGTWHTEKFDPELRPHLMLADYCEVNGQPWWPSDEDAIDEAGWLASKGQTPKECLEEMNRLADLLPSGCDAAVEDLASIIREIDSEEESGIPFTNQAIPSPEIVLQPS
jgi:hypothetical protein